MAKYKVQLTTKAAKQFDKLPDSIAIPILEVIQNLENEPRPKGCKKLKARKGYRIRYRDYRIIYEIFDTYLLIDVLAIGHRKDIY